MTESSTSFNITSIRCISFLAPGDDNAIGSSFFIKSEAIKTRSHRDSIGQSLTCYSNYCSTYSDDNNQHEMYRYDMF